MPIMRDSPAPRDAAVADAVPAQADSDAEISIPGHTDASADEGLSAGAASSSICVNCWENAPPSAAVAGNRDRDPNTTHDGEAPRPNSAQRNNEPRVCNLEVLDQHALSIVIGFLSSHDINGILDQSEKDNWCRVASHCILPFCNAEVERLNRLTRCRPDWYGWYCHRCKKKGFQKWTRARHFGACGQGCGCCRARNPEDGPGSCALCQAEARVAMVNTECNRIVFGFPQSRMPSSAR